VAEKGFFILPGDLFVNVRAKAKGDPNLNETLERVFRNIEASAVGADSEDDLKGLFDDLDVNSPKLGNTVARRNEKHGFDWQQAGVIMDDEPKPL
jgi:type I restriction enzyme M protein